MQGVKDQAGRIGRIKDELAEALDAARPLVSGTPESWANTCEVQRLRKELSAAIAEGAEPCVLCGCLPHGMEQPSARGGIEYEIGCIPCGPFEHVDGTVREPRVRGGMFPHHAVEMWNAGPGFWLVKKG